MMRYLIETVENEGAIGSTISGWERNGQVNILTKGDPIEQIKKSLIKISDALKILRDAGINEEVMKSYIKSKGVALRDIENVFHHQNEFLEMMGLLK